MVGGCLELTLFEPWIIILRYSGGKTCVIMHTKLIFPQVNRVVSAWGGQRLGIGVEGHSARSGEISYGLVTRCSVGHNWEAEFFFFKMQIRLLEEFWQEFPKSFHI